MDDISWGIIGCGDVTELKSGPAFSKVPHSTLHAVMRRDGARAADYARRHSVPEWYQDASALINDPKVNAVYIATPPDSHEAYALSALAAGKPVYIEKPMTLDTAGALRIADAVHRSGVPLSVAHYRRRQPLFLKVKELIDSGAIGKPEKAMLLFRKSFHHTGALPWRLDPAISGGGLFHDLAPHQLDLLLYFFGPPLKVEGEASNSAGHYAAADTVRGSILFRNGVQFSGDWHFAAGEDQRTDQCTITGNKGSLSFAVFGEPSVTLENNEGRQTISFPPLLHVQQPMIESVVRYFRGQAPNPCSVEEGVGVMKIIDEITS